MFANYRYNWKKGNKKLFRKLYIFPLFKKCTTHKHFSHIRVCLPKFAIKKLEPGEYRLAKLLCKKLHKQGYQTDLQTLAFFAVSKKQHAYKCIKKFISYCESEQNKASRDGILDYVSSGHFVGIGEQADGMMVLELFAKQVNMHKCCVHSLINVIITNIFQHLTYEATKKGLIIVIDNLGYNLRLWHDRKFFYIFKILECVFHFEAIVNVDTSRRFSNLFIGFLNSVELADVGYMVRRSDNLRVNIFQRAVWSEVVWGGKQLPMLRAKFPHIKLSKQFGGSNEHLLKLFSAQEGLSKSLLEFRIGDLTAHEFKDESKKRGSRLKSTQVRSTTPTNNVKNYIYSECAALSDISTYKAPTVPKVPSIELSSIPEFHSGEIEDSSSSSSSV